MKHHSICLGLAMLAMVCLSTGCGDQAAVYTKGSAVTFPMTDLGLEITVFNRHDGKRQVFSRLSTTADIRICSEREYQKLSRLTHVKNLTLHSCGSCFTISGLAPLKDLTRLESFDGSTEDLTDLGALTGLVNLKRLTLPSGHIRDLSPLSGLYNLEELRLSSNYIQELSPLSDLPRLRVLELDSNPIQDITPLSGLDSRTRLSLVGTNLAWDDWEPVKGLSDVNGRPSLENAGISPCPPEWLDRIQAGYPGKPILSLDYDDYDGDGSYEAFAFVASRELPSDYLFEGYGGTLVLVTPDSMEELISKDSGLIPGGYFRFGDRKIVKLEHVKYFTSSVSYLWTVEGGSPRAMNLSGLAQSFQMDDEGNLTMRHRVYDGTSNGMGHSYKPYYFYFDGRDFVEYGAIPITTSQFLTCRGAKEILRDIENDGMTVDTILYRNNGMIHLNLNLAYRHDQWSSNFYRTLRLEDDQVTLIGQDMGHYLDAMTQIPVDYPSEFPLFPIEDDRTN